ncbi:hypothetical protein NUL63_004575 [Salmonella enterica]|nr:hypothetical protein [Salmonella enterica]
MKSRWIAPAGAGAKGLRGEPLAVKQEFPRPNSIERVAAAGGELELVQPVGNVIPDHALGAVVGDQLLDLLGLL